MYSGTDSVLILLQTKADSFAKSVDPDETDSPTDKKILLQTVYILMRQLVRGRLSKIYIICYFIVDI